MTASGWQDNEDDVNSVPKDVVVIAAFTGLICIGGPLPVWGGLLFGVFAGVVFVNLFVSGFGWRGTVCRGTEPPPMPLFSWSLAILAISTGASLLARW